MEKEMAKITTTAFVEKCKGYFACYTPDTIEDCSLAGYGSTPKEAMDDMLVTYSEIKEINSENGISTPELNFKYQFDVPSFFAHFKWINVSKFAEVIGINPSLLRQYASGLAKASAPQIEKINKSLEKISSELRVEIA